MQRVGFDRIDLPTWPPAQQEQQGQAEHQAAERRDQDRADRVDRGLT